MPHIPITTQKTLLLLVLFGGLWLAGGCAGQTQGELDGTSPARPPNVVIIFADDMAYADIGVYGAEGLETPHLDRMAAEGLRFTDFHAAAPVCSASRAGLLTGAYPQRVGITGALMPEAEIGIHPDEVLLSELLQKEGYATALVGKWHLGDRDPFLPTRHGFDEFYGLPYSNDMWPKHPNPRMAELFDPLPLVEGDDVVEFNPDQSQFTTDFTERAVDFIDRNQSRPFFLYLSHPMPHVPLFVSDKFEGTSERGLYGDVIQEVDWSVGQVLEALLERDLAENTLVAFTSDNGPWLVYGDHAGTADPLREGKHTNWEGGQREPAIFWWPGTIPAGIVSNELASALDIFPTVARLAGAPLPANKIDGHDIWPLLTGEEGAASPWDVLYHYSSGELQAVRSGDWKLVLPHQYVDVVMPGKDGDPGETRRTAVDLSLFNVRQDIGETTNAAEQNVDVIERMLALAEEARDELGDALTDREGRNIREPGRAPDAATLQ